MKYVYLSIPKDYPAYVDYAVEVLNGDGSVTLLRDLNTEDNYITIETDQFRAFAVVWGKKGAFSEYRAS